MDFLNPNIAARLVEAARRHPSRPALIESRRGRRRALTYEDLAQRIAAFAAAFRDRGVRRGERVLLLVPMSIELYVVLLAVLHAGGTAVFVDAWAGWRRVDEAARKTRPRLFVGSLRAHMLRLVSPAVRAIPSAMIKGPRGRGRPRGPALAPEPLESSSPALVTFTTGSTGSPKASLRTHAFLWEQHEVLSRHLGPSEGDVDMPTLPIFVLHNLASGVTSVLPDFDPRRPAEIDPARIRRQLVCERVTSATGSPAFFDRLLEAGKLPLRRVYTGGAPVLPALARRLEAGTEGKAFVVYGSTEAEPISLIEVGEMRVAMDETGGDGICVGTPVSEIRVRIMRPGSSEAVAQGEAGEIVVSGPQVQTAYFDDETADLASKISDGSTVWHRTGDGGRADDHGRLWLLGRVGSRVTARGRTWWSLPAELRALRLEGVGHAAYLGVEGRGAVLCLEGAELGSRSGLLERARRQLDPYPVDEVRVLERIPRDPRHASKTDARALRERLGLAAPTSDPA